MAGIGLASCSKVQRPSLPMSGNERSCSSENIRAATATTPTTHGHNRTNRSGRDQHPSAERA